MNAKQAAAEEAINRLFSDQSVPRASTRAALEDLKELISELLETLDDAD